MNDILYGLITGGRSPLILAIGTDEKEVKKNITADAQALFKCCFEEASETVVISYTSLKRGFEPTKEHNYQVRNFIHLMIKLKRPFPIRQLNKGNARII